MSLFNHRSETASHLASKFGHSEPHLFPLRPHSTGGRKPLVSQGRHGQNKDTYITNFQTTRISTAPTPHSIHPQGLNSSIPVAKIIRPHTATLERSEPLDQATASRKLKSAGKLVSDTRAAAFTGSNHSSLIAGTTKKPVATALLTSEAGQAMMNVPMKMYSTELRDKIDLLKIRTKEKAAMMGEIIASDQSSVAGPPAGQQGKVSPFNMPFRTHVNFQLKTQDQVMAEMQQIADDHKKIKQTEEKKRERKQKAAWLAKVRNI